MFIHSVGCRHRERDRNLPLTLTRRWTWSRSAPLCLFNQTQNANFTYLLVFIMSHYSVSNSNFTFTGNVLSTDCCSENKQKEYAEDTNNNLQCHCNLWKFLLPKYFLCIFLLTVNYPNKMFYFVVGSNQ